MGEKSDYLIAAFDLHLGEGMSPMYAWARAAEDYAYVFSDNEHGTHLSRAAERALIALEPDGDVE